MADLRRLLNIRLLGERICEEKLVEVRHRLSKLLALLDDFHQERLRTHQEHMESLSSGDDNGAAQHCQSWMRLGRAIEQVRDKYLQEVERVKSLQQSYALAHQDRRKVEALAESARSEELRLERRGEQRSLDDTYLAGRPRKQPRKQPSQPASSSR